MSQSSASIDDLLQHEEEPVGDEPGRRERPGLGGWLRTAASAGALTAVTIVGMRLFGVALPVVAVLSGWLALLLLRRVTGPLRPPPPGRRRSYSGGEDDSRYRFSGEDALGRAVARWERRLAWSQGEPDRFARGVLPPLGELADDRLRQRHGLDRRSDPTRARALLGEEVWALLDTTTTRHTPSPRDLAAVIARLEKV
ncbi:hypothetical protein [Micromonospora echinofusca]|uniref:DUF4129 domain-containing protein n=1 Tax=Micromonospora echinofusca TaxID=47858 RepID=A0ABS3VW61_MICEH|nr:hypothetical protein [Micromonospora echinofusca]MBO4208706.1 hypothetical protein [Micromonospora echinofusca]